MPTKQTERDQRRLELEETIAELHLKAMKAAGVSFRKSTDLLPDFCRSLADLLANFEAETLEGGK